MASRNGGYSLNPPVNRTDIDAIKNGSHKVPPVTKPSNPAKHPAARQGSYDRPPTVDFTDVDQFGQHFGSMAIPTTHGRPAAGSYGRPPTVDFTDVDQRGQYFGAKTPGPKQGSYGRPSTADFTEIDQHGQHFGAKTTATRQGSYNRPPTVDFTDVDQYGQHFGAKTTAARQGSRSRPALVDFTDADLSGRHYGTKSVTRVDFTDVDDRRQGVKGNRVRGAGVGDDKWLFGLVNSLHSGDDYDRQQLLDVSSLFNYAQLIFSRATLTTAHSGGDETDIAWEAASAKLEVTTELTMVIEQVLCEMEGGDSHKSTVAVLGILESHSWEAKMVVTVAALAVKYGEFLLLSEMYSRNPFAKAIAMLKKHPAAAAATANLEAVRYLIKLVLQLTSHVVRFCQHRSTSDCFPHDDRSITSVFETFSVTAYWIIRSTIIAATHISIVATCSSSTTHDQFMMSSVTERDLTMWSEKLEKIFVVLDENMTYVEQIMGGRREEKAYSQLLTTIFETEYQNNTTVISTLISSNTDKECSLYSRTKQVSVDILKEETVLLLITSIDEPIDVLLDLYDELKVCSFSILWIPVVEGSVTTWSDAYKSFLRKKMSWYSVEDPSKIRKEVIRFFKEELHFNGSLTLIPIDSRGRITTMNVRHMIKLWKNDAYPFTRTRGMDLWNAQSSLTLDLFLPNDIDPRVSSWVKEDKYIMAYGGEVDVEWIRQFTQATRSIAEMTSMEFECIYFGKSCKKETVRKIISSIETESLGNYLAFETIQVFWSRLESMVHSRVQLEMVDDESDIVMREIKRITSYDKSTASWVLICKGSRVISCVSGSAITEVLVKYDEWKVKVDIMGGFEDALLAQISAARVLDHNCFRFEFPTALGKIPRAMRCPGCQKRMDLYTTFLCCHESVHHSSKGKIDGNVLST